MSARLVLEFPGKVDSDSSFEPPSPHFAFCVLTAEDGEAAKTTEQLTRTCMSCTRTPHYTRTPRTCTPCMPFTPCVRAHHSLGWARRARLARARLARARLACLACLAPHASHAYAYALMRAPACVCKASMQTTFRALIMNCCRAGYGI
eukprot:3743145-Pleurochrysis_carterae.AAC.3